LWQPPVLGYPMLATMIPLPFIVVLTEVVAGGGGLISSRPHNARVHVRNPRYSSHVHVAPIDALGLLPG
jgi:hypothetical protein